MKNGIFVLLFFLMSFNAWAENTESECSAMGYNTPVLDCLASKGVPLLCPYYSIQGDGNSVKDERLSLCINKSCRGYPLLKNEKDGTYYYLDNSGGYVSANPPVGRLEDLVEGEMESCTVGFGNDAITYYRVPNCKEGYVYQNNICGEGCLKDKYPYNYHPGNLPGELEECVDSNSRWYGYMSCYNGWTGGYAATGVGKCFLADCKIEEYPYLSDPNEKEKRGETTTCRIGGNSYYKYISCDGGFTQSGAGGLCIKDCKIKKCEKNKVSDDFLGLEYNDWSCVMSEAATCRIGDNLFFCSGDSDEDCQKLGTIVHMPDSVNNKVVVMGKYLSYSAWGQDEGATTGINYVYDVSGDDASVAKQDIEGRYKTAGIKKFAEEKGYKYPAAEACYKYDIGCDAGSICAVGEWYLPALGEVAYIQENKYILNNAIGLSWVNFLQYLSSSSEQSASLAWILRADGFGYPQQKTTPAHTYPVLSFSVK